MSMSEITFLGIKSHPIVEGSKNIPSGDLLLSN